MQKQIRYVKYFQFQCQFLIVINSIKLYSSVFQPINNDTRKVHR